MWSGAGLGVPAALGQHREISALALPPPAQRRYGNGEKQPSAWKRPCCAQNRGENGSKGEFGGARGTSKPAAAGLIPATSRSGAGDPS